MEKDHEHLKLLTVFHYVVAAMTALFSLFPIIHLIVGVAFILGADEMQTENGEPPPVFIGWIFAIIGGTIITIGWVLASCIFTTGRMLAKRRHHLFCIVMAGIECLLMPFGTVLGVFTILVLMRDSVKQEFSANRPSLGQIETKPDDGQEN